MTEEEQKKQEIVKLETMIEKDYRFRKTFGPIVHVMRGATIIIGIAALGALLQNKINQITIVFIYVAVLDQIVTRSMEALDQYRSEKRIDKNYEAFHQMKNLILKGGDKHEGK